MGQQKKLPDFRKLHLKCLHGLRTYANSPTLGFSTRATAGRTLVTYGKWVNDWKWGEYWANLQKPGSSIVSSLSPTPPQNLKMVKQVVLPW